MIHINAIPEDFEPRNKILSKLSEHVSNINEFVLMTHSQSGFLCGMIKQFRPKKILEVGVAAGGSTAIILQALEDLGEPYEMHSVDISPNCFLAGQTKNIGFLATLAKENNLFTPPPNQPCAVNINFISENFCRKSSTKSAATLTS